MLRVTGGLADSWTPSYNYAPPHKIPEMQKIIDDSAIASGRKPDSVRRNYNLTGKITEDKISEDKSIIEGNSEDLLIGSIDFWIDTLVKFYKDLKMDTFTFWPVSHILSLVIDIEMTGVENGRWYIT